MVPMKYHVYIWLETLGRQLTTTIELPEDSMHWTNAQLNDLIRAQVDPMAKGAVFNNYRIDGLREHDDLPPPPPPAWLAYADTRSVFPNHHPAFGPQLQYQWSEFLSSVLGHAWGNSQDWKLGAPGFGYPPASDEIEKVYIPYRSKRLTLTDEIPHGWCLASSHGQGHLGVCHPSIHVPSLFSGISTDRNNFSGSPENPVNFISPRPGKPLFCAQTHPVFYVALYEFWQYLHELPLWAYLPTTSIITDNRNNADWTAQTMLSLGLAASSFRWGWWSMLNHAFPQHSRALDILKQHYPDCHSDGTIAYCPLGMELSPELCVFPPKLRIFIDPLGR